MRFSNSRLIPVLVTMVFCCLILLSAPGDSLAPADESRVLVKAEGFTLQRSDVEKAAAGKMKELDLEALRAPARVETRRHAILSETMQELAYEKLLMMEVGKTGNNNSGIDRTEDNPPNQTTDARRAGQVFRTQQKPAAGDQGGNNHADNFLRGRTAEKRSLQGVRWRTGERIRGCLPAASGPVRSPISRTPFHRAGRRCCYDCGIL